MAQSLQPHEIIIVDDASTDDSVNVVKELARTNSKIVLLENEKNQGCCLSTNRAIAVATGNFIFPTAADDLILPGYFEKSINGFQRYPQAGVCVTRVKYINFDGHEIFQKKSCLRQLLRQHPDIGAIQYLEPTELITRLKRDPRFIYGGPSPLFRKEVIIESGGLRDELGPYTDWFNVHFAALKYGLIHIPEPLVAFRLIAGGFGETATRNPLLAIGKLAHVLELMRSDEFQGVFPVDFVRQKEAEFTYLAFASSINVAYQSLRSGIDTVIPPKTYIDKVILYMLTTLHLLTKAILLFYSQKKQSQVCWPVVRHTHTDKGSIVRKT